MYLGLAMILAAVPAPLPQPQKDAGAVSDISGHYKVSGVAPTGSKYNAGLVILRVGDVYAFDYTSSTVGIGVRKGNTVSVSWKRGDTFGVTQYQIGADGSLSGTWVSVPSNGKTGTEKAIKVSELEKDEEDEK